MMKLAVACAALCVGATGAWAQSTGLGGAFDTDVIEGPLLRGARSGEDPRDFSGVWFVRLYSQRMLTTNGRNPPFTPKGKALWEARAESEKVGRPLADASAYCWPHGVPRIMNSPYPIQIIQSKGETTIIHEVNHNIRHIYLDEKLPETVPLTFLGSSVGHWEGDTLVVETRGVRDETWMDERGVPHGVGMKVTERFRKIEDGKVLEDLVKIEDPEYFTEPFFHRIHYAWRPDMRLTEYVCEENNRNKPVNGITQ